jgi:hypothetical protein
MLTLVVILRYIDSPVVDSHEMKVGAAVDDEPPKKKGRQTRTSLKASEQMTVIQKASSTKGEKKTRPNKRSSPKTGTKRK